MDLAGTVNEQLRWLVAVVRNNGVIDDCHTVIIPSMIKKGACWMDSTKLVILSSSVESPGLIN